MTAVALPAPTRAQAGNGIEGEAERATVQLIACDREGLVDTTAGIGGSDPGGKNGARMGAPQSSIQLSAP